MKTSTRSGSAAIVTLVLSVLSLVVIATVVASVRRDNITCRSNSDINDNGDCAGPDLTITSVDAYASGAGNNRTLTVYIKNVGNSPAVIDYPRIAGWQAYLSKDGISKDVLVLGGNFSGTVGIGQTTSASAIVSAGASFHQYLIVELYLLSIVGDCNSENNTYILTSPPQ